ncbi:MAG: GTPase ObgE [Gammaproteobacteria bacterium]
MGKSAFIDEVEVAVCGGKGGDGAVSFLRERARPRGGPDGGNGGKGGDVWMRASLGVNTLLAYRRRRKAAAANGKHGGGKGKCGAAGEDVILTAPVGTLIMDADTGAAHAELLRPQQTVLLASGGGGGRGNASFKSSVNRAPRHRTTGEKGDIRRFVFVLQLLANIGLVGMPNAGKSTLLSALSAAKPKIADYPFTTLAPQLGFVGDDIGGGATVADLPGLISGAADGAGLGNRFLRHISRTGLLCYVIDSGGDAANDIAALDGELSRYQESGLADFSGKPKMLALNKMDLLTAAQGQKLMKAMRRSFSGFVDIMAISALHGDGVADMAARFLQLVDGGIGEEQSFDKPAAGR